MVFSIFKKSRKPNAGESLIDPDSAARGDSIIQPNSSNGSPSERRDQARKRQVEMTAKIDQIEQEMRGEFPTITRPTMPRKATPVPQGVQVPQSVQREPQSVPNRNSASTTSPPTLPPLDMSTGGLLGSTDAMGAIDVSESSEGMSPAVEEAAVLYANGQAVECVKALKDAIASDETNREAWLLLFEVHQQADASREFEMLAMDYSVRFESSPPAWRQLQRTPRASAVRPPDAALVVLPRFLDGAIRKEIEQFQSHAKQDRMRLSFEAVREVDAEGAQLVLELLRRIATSQQQVRLTGVEVSIACLRNVLVPGERTKSEQAWLLAMELLRLSGREKEYDDLSVDYTVTFEVSPPQYEPPPRNILVGAQAGTATEAGVGAVRAGPAALSGNLTGKATDALAQLDAALVSGAEHFEVDCSQLARVDFAAAGSLLNWLTAVQARGRHCTFTQVNPLVAALFGVMGINGVAEVVRRKA